MVTSFQCMKPFSHSFFVLLSQSVKLVEPKQTEGPASCNVTVLTAPLTSCHTSGRMKIVNRIVASVQTFTGAFVQVYMRCNMYLHDLLRNMCVVLTQQNSQHLRRSWSRSFRSSTLGCCLWPDQ